MSKYSCKKTYSPHEFTIVFGVGAKQKRAKSVHPVFIPFSGCPMHCVYCAQDRQTGKTASCSLDALLAEAERSFSSLSPCAPDESRELAFYGGNLTYRFTIEGGGKKTIEIGKYRGAVIKVFVDGEEKGYVDFPPHRLFLGELSEGEHTVELILYGNRMNTFGQLHKTDEFLEWTGPDSWRTKGRFWTDEYMLTRTGILTAPRILTEE